MDVIVIASNGRSALERTSFKLTFNPSPTIAAVSNQVVNVEIKFNTFSDIGMTSPNTYVPNKLHTIKPTKDHGSSMEEASD